MIYKSYENEIGNKYYKVTIIKYMGRHATPKNAHVPMVKVKCECGKQKIVSLWDLKSGKTKTCGFNHPHYDDRSIPAFNNIYKFSYRKRALDKGLEFALTAEEFKNICEKACHYCGMLPNNFMATSGWSSSKVRGKIKSGKYISEWKYNGLDRLDNNKGYTLNNVVPCCGTCNHAKHSMSYKDFVDWLDRIAKFRTSI